MTTKYKTLNKKQINDAIKIGLQIAHEDVSLEKDYHSKIGASESRRDTFVATMVGKESTIGSSGSVVLAVIATDLYAATGDKNDNVIKMWRQSLVRSTKVDQEDGSFKYLTFTWDKDDIGIIQSKTKAKKVKTESTEADNEDTLYNEKNCIESVKSIIRGIIKNSASDKVVKSLINWIIKESGYKPVKLEMIK